MLKTSTDKKTIKLPSGTTGPIMRRIVKKEEGYRYTPLIKPENELYGKTKIKIVQDIRAHEHHFKHPFNILSNQYNEFIRLIFKNNKNDNKLNLNYVVGLSKAIGLNLKKEAFSVENLSNRDHL